MCSTSELALPRAFQWSFQFGTNWAPFSEATGDFFGSILGFEASMAFMLEAGFLGIMLFWLGAGKSLRASVLYRNGGVWG